MTRPARGFLAAVALALALLTHPVAAETIQLRKHPGGGYTIPGRINDAVSLTFILDTGASDVSIPDEVAREMERAGKLERGDFIGTRTYVLADGSKVPSRRVLLRELTVGDQTVSNVTASIGRPGSPPLLGQSFLSKFASWTLDNERNVLVLQSKSGIPANSDGGGRGGAPYGAFAHDETSGRYGASWNQPSRARADEAALKGCASEFVQDRLPHHGQAMRRDRDERKRQDLGRRYPIRPHRRRARRCGELRETQQRVMSLAQRPVQPLTGFGLSFALRL